MNITLDGETVFDAQDLKIVVGSPNRAYVERAVPRLDGTVSIDMGRRPRQIRQSGVLRAASPSAMAGRLNAIAAFIDGRTHTLVNADGQVYESLRMDAFRKGHEHVGGPGTVVEYEIIYTQLGD